MSRRIRESPASLANSHGDHGLLCYSFRSIRIVSIIQPFTEIYTLMSDVTQITFPPDFQWGVATAAYQIEGAVREDGRGESIWDRFSHTPGKTIDGDTGDIACDHYHRVDEDIQLLKTLGVKAYRFSIAWPRIIPDGGTVVNQRGLDFYSELTDKLLAAGITPYATLYHWDLPQPLEDLGGWLNRDTTDRFAYYTDVISRKLGDRVKHWATFNEPWCSAFLGYGFGVHAPGQMGFFKAGLAATHTLLLAHGKAVPVLRQNVPDGQVGIVINPMQADPASDSEADRAAAWRNDGYQSRWFFDPIFKGAYPADMVELYGADVPPIEADDMAIISAPIDFLGVNFYNRTLTADDPGGEPLRAIGRKVPGAEYTTMGWEVEPGGLYRLLTRIHRDYAPKAMYVTENGAAFQDVLEPDGVHDHRRVAYLQGHFAAAAQAIADGVPLHGYFVWSMMDNFEWGFGYSQRFGIIYVDYATQRRILKDSARFLIAVTSANAVPILTTP